MEVFRFKFWSSGKIARLVTSAATGKCTAEWEMGSPMGFAAWGHAAYNGLGPQLGFAEWGHEAYNGLGTALGPPFLRHGKGLFPSGWRFLECVGTEP